MVDNPRDKIKTINLTPEIIEGPWQRFAGDPGPQSADDYSVISKNSPVNPMPVVVLSDDHISREFIDFQEDYLRFDHDRASWFIWRGSHWQRDETGETIDRIRAFCVRMAPGADTPSNQRKLASLKNTKNIEEFSRTDRRVAVAASHWNRDPYLIATPGGTVDLRTGVAREARPDDMISRICAATPSVAEDCPIWKQFLSECCMGNQDQIDFLQKMAGYTLTGDTREHILIFVYGPGGNGKSVFLNALSGIMGDYAITAPIETFTKSAQEKHPTDLAMLSGPRLVSASETEEGKRWAESRIKSLTGGDPISARFMHKDFFTFIPVFKLIIVGNHMPSLGSVDDAARRRFRLVPFENKPKIVDRTLEKKLRAEWPGIMRWMINGCLKWQMDGLAAPDNIQNATNKYFSDQDVMQQWMDERCEFSQEYISDSILVFGDWTRFAEENNEYVGTKKAFTQKVERKGFPCQLKRFEGRPRRCYIGMRLKFANHET